MIYLSTLIKQFGPELIKKYRGRLLPSHYRALNAMAHCRTNQSLQMKAICSGCDNEQYVPHSCGHRNCPHCQHHDSQQWLERQLQKRINAEYFMVTFTLPRELRPLAWAHQRAVYQAMITSAWETLKLFSENDKQLQGTPGAIMVLHTHARNLDHHPHVHVVIPAAAVDTAKKCWRTKTFESKKHFLFDHKALAIVFRTKLLDEFKSAKLTRPNDIPKKWIVDCRSVGSGESALVYLGRYLYRGVIQEKEIVSCIGGKVTYRWEDNESGKTRMKTLNGEDFLWALLRHVLPKRFRRARNFGFLHPNSKTLIHIIQTLFPRGKRQFTHFKKVRAKMSCKCCGAEMVFIQFRMPPFNGRKATNLQ